jgi:F-type H+-transporting ATPase subunit delta
MPLACGTAIRAGGHDIERVDVSEPASISSGIAARYAAAVFELAKDEGALPALEKDMDALGAAWSESADLRDLATSPVYAREEQQKAIAAVAAKMGLSTVTANTLALMGSKRRLFVLPQMVADVQNRIATEKGEITAEVTAAAPLSPEQAARLAATLKARAGKDVKLKTTVDESLIGGLVVKLGSSMIDTSVKARLAALQNAMKEVG